MTYDELVGMVALKAGITPRLALEALSVIDHGGYAIVPREATEEMKQAVWDAVSRNVYCTNDPEGSVTIETAVGRSAHHAAIAAGEIKPEEGR